MEGKRITHFDFTLRLILVFRSSSSIIVMVGGDSGKFLSAYDAVVILYLVLTL